MGRMPTSLKIALALAVAPAFACPAAEAARRPPDRRRSATVLPAFR